MKLALSALLFCLLVAAGCSSSGPSGIPGGSRLVDERPEGVTFTAPENGTLYVRDVAADRVAIGLPIKTGQIFTAHGLTATLDGKPLPASDLRADAMYQLFFKAGGQREYHPSYNP